MNRIAAKQNQVTLKSDVDVIDSIKSLRNYTLILGAGIIVIGLMSALFLMRSITKPVNFLKNVVVKLGRGELVEDKQGKSQL